MSGASSKVPELEQMRLLFPALPFHPTLPQELLYFPAEAKP